MDDTNREPSAADDGVCLDLDEPAGIQEPLDDNEARSRPDPAEGLAVHLCDGGAMSSIDYRVPSTSPSATPIAAPQVDAAG